MNSIEVGRLVKALITIENVRPGEPRVLPGTHGRVMRVEGGRGMAMVRWSVGGRPHTVDLYARFDEVEVIAVEAPHEG